MALPATIDTRVQVSWDGTGAFDGPYDDVTGDTIADPGVTIQQGKDGARTLSPPMVASCDFGVFNDTGKYSQERPDSPVYQRVVPGRPVRVLAHHGEETVYDNSSDYDSDDYYDGVASYVLVRSAIDQISQSTGWGARKVDLTTLGLESLFVAANVTIAVMTAPRVDQCVTAILDAVGWPSTQRQVSIADTVLTYWWCDNRAPWDALQELLRSEGPGAIYVDDDAVFHFENRNYRTITPRSTTSQAAFFDQPSGAVTEYDTDENYDSEAFYDGQSGAFWFTALSYDPGFTNIRNRAEYTVTTRRLDALGVVWTYGVNLQLTAGQTVTLIARPSTPFQNAVTPVGGTDYTVTGGTVSVSMAASSGLAAFITLTATGGGPLVSGLQLRAQPLTQVGQTTIANSVDASASIAKFSPIPGADIPIVLDVQGWPEIAPGAAQAVCDAWVTRYMVQRPAVTITLRNADADHVVQMLQRKVSDRITIRERNTGLAGDVWINSKSLQIQAHCGVVLTCVLGCEKCEEIAGFVWDGATSTWDHAIWGV